jgi:hypothetical protein
MQTPQLRQAAAVTLMAFGGTVVTQGATPAPVPQVVGIDLEGTVREATSRGETPTADQLALTDEKIEKRAVEAKGAGPGRFRPLADLLNALRNRHL